MFSARDIRHILQVLTPAFPSTNQDQPPFLTTSDDSGIVLLSTAQRKLQALIETRGGISLSDLRRELNVTDLAPLLQWADTQPSLSTPRIRRPDITPIQQRCIALYILYHTRRRFVDLRELHVFWGVSLDVLEQILGVYARLPRSLERYGEYIASTRLVRRLQGRVLTVCANHAADGGDGDVLLSQAEGLRAVPRTVLVQIMSELQRQRDELGSYEVLEQDGQVVLALSGAARAESHARMLRDLEAGLASRLERDGFVMLQGHDRTRDEALENLLSRASESCQELKRAQVVEQTDWPADRVLISTKTLDGVLTRIENSIPAASDSVWEDQQDKDMTFTLSVRDHILKHHPSDAIMHFVCKSTSLDGLLPQWDARMTTLRTGATAALLQALSTALFAPVALYTAPLPTLTHDPTLHSNQSSTILTHLQKTIIAELPSHIARPAPAPPTAAAGELSRFLTASSGARTLPDLLGALKRLRRKLQVPEEVAPDVLRDVCDKYLRERLDLLLGPQTRRASDVLQFVIWILLACVPLHGAGSVGAGNAGVEEVGDGDGDGSRAGEGVGEEGEGGKEHAQTREKGDHELWVGGGKDVGRLVKLLARRAEEVSAPIGKDIVVQKEKFNWVEAARDVAAFRDVVVKGSQTEAHVQSMRNLAGRAYEARR